MELTREETASYRLRLLLDALSTETVLDHLPRRVRTAYKLADFYCDRPEVKELLIVVEKKRAENLKRLLVDLKTEYEKEDRKEKDLRASWEWLRQKRLTEG